jgi:hypothetical protein
MSEFREIYSFHHPGYDLDCSGSVGGETPDNRKQSRRTLQIRGNALIFNENIRTDMNQLQISVVVTRMIFAAGFHAYDHFTKKQLPYTGRVCSELFQLSYESV